MNEEKKYLTPGQWAKREGITRQRAHFYLREKRIPGVISEKTMLGKTLFYVPESIRLSEITRQGGRPKSKATD